MSARLRALATVFGFFAAATPALALDICVEGAYPPFSQVNADGTITGFDIDIAQALCAAMEQNCRLVQADWTELIPALRGGACDAIIASMSDTPERRRLIDFSAPYYRSPARFVAAAGRPDGPDWPAGHTIGVQLGTTNQYYMQAHFPGVELRYYGDQDHLLLDLEAGRLDAVLAEAVQLDTGFLSTPAGSGSAFVGPPLFDPAIQGDGAAIGVRDGETALRDDFTAAIARIRADGTYQKLSEHYFGADIYGE